MSEGNGHTSELGKMRFLLVYLSGVTEPLMTTCRDVSKVWHDLQDAEPELRLVSWQTVSGETVIVRPSHVSAIHALWEPADDRVAAELDAARQVLEGEWPASQEYAARVWLVGRPEPLSFTFDLQDVEWPVPWMLLYEGMKHWLGWLDEDGEAVLIQGAHIVAMVYPTEWDTAALEADLAQDDDKGPGRG